MGSESPSRHSKRRWGRSGCAWRWPVGAGLLHTIWLGSTPYVGELPSCGMIIASLAALLCVVCAGPGTGGQSERRDGARRLASEAPVCYTADALSVLLWLGASTAKSGAQGGAMDDAWLRSGSAHDLGQLVGHMEQLAGVRLVEAAFALTNFGLETRHLRAFKVSADREAGLVAQIASPIAKGKGTGAWTVIAAAEQGVSVSVIAEALFARSTSSATARSRTSSTATTSAPSSAWRSATSPTPSAWWSRPPDRHRARTRGVWLERARSRPTGWCPVPLPRSSPFRRARRSVGSPS